MATVEVKPDDLSWNAVVRAFRDEADGRELRRDLGKLWRGVAVAAAKDAKAAALDIPAPRSHHVVGLREAIAAGIKAHVSTGQTNPARQQFPGMSVAWHRSPSGKKMRGRPSERPVLWRSGWLLNRGKTWKHMAWGRPSGRRVGIPQAKGWFDNATRPHMAKFDLAVREGYAMVVRRIRAKTKG